MDKVSAVNLIRDTFEHPFDKGSYINFLRNLLNKPDIIDEKLITGIYIPAAFRNHIKSYYRVGKYYSPNEERIDLLVINLHKNSSLAHARTMQRNFIRWYLKYGRNGADKDAVLTAIISPDEEDWRFSLVKMEYTLNTDSLQAKEEVTPAKRYSFLVGRNERSHTAQQTLLPLLLDDKNLPTLADLEQTFNIEKITNEFFLKYKELFYNLKDALDVELDRQPVVKTEFVKNAINTDDFAKKLLGQIVFLYFLQKKGWFGVGRDAQWGTGPKGYIRSIFEKEQVEYDNFFNDILEPLFYYTLARPRPDDYSEKLNCKIPFLNGGLFDPLNDYDWLHTDILLPNELFSNDKITSEGYIGTGILDVFDRYNFTVCEDEPLEREVAVDPEMLGKVFENLLEVSDRKSKGAFYTPREIVHYMCQESLINYLSVELPLIDRVDIEFLIKSGDTTIENDAEAALRDVGNSTIIYKLPEQIRQNAASIDNKLNCIRVCDPAVGSGAFVVGMMNEIVRARLTLAGPSNRPHTPYKLKRHAIQNCLYGVDLEIGAVEIAKLRLWLSLVVDEEDRANIQPLPNLDYKIMQGNSLLDEYKGVKLFDDSIISGSNSTKTQIEFLEKQRTPLQREYFELKFSTNPDELRIIQLEKEIKRIADNIKKLLLPKTDDSQNGLWDRVNASKDKADELRKLHLQFFKESNADDKKHIKLRIELLGWELIETSLKEQGKDSSLVEVAQFKEKKTKPFFLWKLNFWEVFEEKRGFDIVIGNPPYVRIQLLTKSDPDQAASLKHSYSSASKGNYDLYVVFVERSLQLLGCKGHLSFILPHKFFNAQYGECLRSLLALGRYVQHVVHFGDQQVFPGASNYVCLLFLANTGSDKCRWVRVDDLSTWLESHSGIECMLPASSITADHWNFSIGRGSALFDRLKGFPTKLVDATSRIFQGIKTSADAVYIVEKIEIAEDIVRVISQLNGQEYKLESALLHPLAKGGDSKRYSLSTTNRMILFPYSSNGCSKACLIQGDIMQQNYPLTWEYLEKHKEKLENREDGKMNGNGWYAYGRSQALDMITHPKIFTPDIAPASAFSYDNTGEVFFTGGVSGGYGITPKLGINPEFLLAILNSRLLDFYHHKIATQMRGGWFSYEARFIRHLPVWLPDLAKNQDCIYYDKLVDCADQILKSKRINPSVDMSSLECEIDNLVYELYQLTPDEIALVEESSLK